MTTSRLVRVFISSTFRDFMGERDELVKRIFPELRRRCKARFVELLEVDLRWGITEEQSKSGETLRICLQEIDRCRPSAPVFFIGMLGERYGWIPPRDFFKEDVLEDKQLGWVGEHMTQKSVTELEILHGVLNNNVMRDKAFFYFRNDGYEKRHWPEIAKHHEGIVPPLTPGDFTNAKSENPAADEAKQQQLKKDICDASLAWDPRPYETPDELGTLVLEDLWQAINEVFPEDSIPTALERQYLEHQAFGESRAKGYVPRGGLFLDLDVFLGAEKENPVKVITGQSGGGKSALIAAWMSHAHAEGILPSRTFFHYIGGTPESSTARSVVLRLMETIRSWGVVSERVPDDFGEAVQLLPEWLATSAEDKGGILLVLDALNQLESSHDQTLWWLPKDLPPGVRLIVSTLPGTAMDELESRGWNHSQLEVPSLTEEEKKTIIASYLGVFRRTLEPRHVERLANAPQTKNPLFLKVVLDELRIRGRYEVLGDMISRMMEAKDPVVLFKQVLKNLEEYDKERPNLVRDALGYLAAARRGLTESELLQLLSSSDNPANEPLPRCIWSPLYLALDESLISRNGRLGFFHDYLRKAVIEIYLSQESDIQKIHARLGYNAIYWGKNIFSPTIREYTFLYGIYHLRICKNTEAIWKILKDETYYISFENEIKNKEKLIQSIQDGIEAFVEIEKIEDEDLGRLAYLLYKADHIDNSVKSSYIKLLKKLDAFETFDEVVKNAKKITEDINDSEIGAILALYCKVSTKISIAQVLEKENILKKFPNLIISKGLLVKLGLNLIEPVSKEGGFTFNCRYSLFYAICHVFATELADDDEYNELIEILNYIDNDKMEVELNRKKQFLLNNDFGKFSNQEIFQYVYALTQSEYIPKNQNLTKLESFLGSDEISKKTDALLKLHYNKKIDGYNAEIIKASNSDYKYDQMLKARFGFLEEALKNSYNDTANILDTYLTQLYLSKSENLNQEAERLFDISESSGRIIRDSVSTMIAKKAYEYGMTELQSKACENLWKRFDTYSDGFYDDDDHATVVEQALKCLFIFEDEFLFYTVLDYLKFDDNYSITRVATAFDEAISSPLYNSEYINQIYNRISELKEIDKFKIYITIFNSIFFNNLFLKKFSLNAMLDLFKSERIFSVIKCRTSGIYLLWLYFMLVDKPDTARSLNKYLKLPCLQK